VFIPETSVLNVPVLHAPGIGMGNIDFAVNLNTLEFVFAGGYLYNPGLAPGDSPAFFDGTLYLPSLVYFDTSFEARLNIVADPPLTFGVQEVISVHTIPPDPDPQPEPDPNPIEASIARGQTQFTNLCVECHGVDGTGGGIYPNLTISIRDTFEELRPWINDVMPFGNPTACQDVGSSTCATDAANYVLYVIQAGGGQIPDPDIPPY
jgi:cytochrome c553